MTRPGGAWTPRTGGIDRWISRAAAGTVAGLAGIAGALSYSHMLQLAQDNGQAGWHAHTIPLSVDGIEVVASLVLLADQRTGHRSGWLPWTALVVGTAGSLAANVAAAGPGIISRIIAGWPALALLIAVKLLSGMLGQDSTSLRAAVPLGLASDQNTGHQRQLTAMPIPTWSPAAARPSRAAAPRRQQDNFATTRTNPSTSAESGMVPGLPGITDLLPAARAARDSLDQDGLRLTRDALAARLRESGYPVGNSRLTALLQALRSESATPSPTSTNTAA